MTWTDKVSEQRINTLRPELQVLCKKHLQACFEKGIFLRVTFGYRSIEEQDALYKLGRDASGKVIDRKAIVTKVKGGKSYHNFRAAYDIVIIENNKAVWQSPLYKTVGEIGESLGLVWGGRFDEDPIGAGNGWDAPHFQLKGKLEDFK